MKMRTQQVKTMILLLFRQCIILFLAGMLLVSCKKYLDEKPQKDLWVPNSLDALQSLEDNIREMNQAGTSLPELVADNYYLPTPVWLDQSILEFDRQNYIWSNYQSLYTIDYDWGTLYGAPIYNSNVILDKLSKIELNSGNQNYYHNVKGAALFFRSFYFYELAQLYCRPYSSSASVDPGIVLRMTTDINAVSVRATVQQTYDQITNDLKDAVALLPEMTLFPTRPNKAAAYGMLARVYLSMSDYVNAGLYADSYLQKNTSLLDYNTLFPLGFPPIPSFNKEIIFYASSFNRNTLSNAKAIIDSSLYNSYDSNDLRKSVFFDRNGPGFQGSYNGSSPTWGCFDGIATDEMYLIKAESSARIGLKDSAMADLNRLLVTRWKVDPVTHITTYVNKTAADATDALNKILIERRKELVYRNLRWSDLRRLNLEGANITLTRIVNGTTYTLPPNDPRWVLLIPLVEINLSGIQQNVR